MTWQLALSGLLIGVLVGTTGMGGGSLLTPLLVIAFGFSRPSRSARTSCTARSSSRSARSGTGRSGRFRPASRAGCSSEARRCRSSASGPSEWLRDRYGDGAQSAQARVLGVALLIGAAGLIAKNLMRFREAPDKAFILTRRDRIAAVLIGLGGGFMVGLTSVGSGVFFGLSLLILFPLRSSKVVGTDIFHAAALLWVAGAGHLAAGNVDLGSVAWLLVGSLPGVLIGSHVSVRLPDRVLQLALAITLAGSGTKLLDLPYSSESAIAVLIVGLIALVVFARAKRVVPAMGA